jgi:hypothetical protein
MLRDRNEDQADVVKALRRASISLQLLPSHVCASHRRQVSAVGYIANRWVHKCWSQEQESKWPQCQEELAPQYNLVQAALAGPERETLRRLDGCWNMLLACMHEA